MHHVRRMTDVSADQTFACASWNTAAEAVMAGLVMKDIPMVTEKHSPHKKIKGIKNESEDDSRR